MPLLGIPFYQTDRAVNGALLLESEPKGSPPLNLKSNKTMRVVVFHCCIAVPTYSTPKFYTYSKILIIGITDPPFMINPPFRYPPFFQ